MTKQLSIRLSNNLHDWLTKHVESIRPATSLNNYINYLIEQDRLAKEHEAKLVDTIAEYKTK